MGMSLEDYLGLTPYQFGKAYELFIQRIKRDREYTTNEMWQVARWQVFRMLCPPKQKRITIFDLIELPGDADLKKLKEANEPKKDQDRFRKLKDKWK